MSEASPTRDLLAAAVRKMPSQGRSLASYDRMLAATRALMLERGDDFTLVDVSERGEVSIGSIYLRFDSKDKLLHAVMAQELLTLVAREEEMHARLLPGSSNLASFLSAYVAAYNQHLSGHANMLGLIMQKASTDPDISICGKETADQSAQMAVASIMRFAGEIGGPNPELKARVAFQTVFATIARQYGLGTSRESAFPEVWPLVLAELPRMMLAYLRSAD